MVPALIILIACCALFIITQVPINIYIITELRMFGHAKNSCLTPQPNTKHGSNLLKETPTGCTQGHSLPISKDISTTAYPWNFLNTYCYGTYFNISAYNYTNDNNTVYATYLGPFNVTLWTSTIPPGSAQLQINGVDINQGFQNSDQLAAQYVSIVNVYCYAYISTSYGQGYPLPYPPAGFQGPYTNTVECQNSGCTTSPDSGAVTIIPKFSQLIGVGCTTVTQDIHDASVWYINSTSCT